MAGLWRRIVDAFRAPAAVTFSESAPRPIDQVIWEMSGRGTSRVTREQALTVPTVLKGRNLICSISTLPLVVQRADNTVVRSALLEQIDPDVSNVVTLAMTLEDLQFEGLAWWEVTARDPAGFPASARHLDVAMVSIDPPVDGRSLNPLPAGYDPRGATVWIDGTQVPASQVIRFDSPNPAVLTAGARAIRRAILLDKAAGMYADDPRPLDYFTPAEGADEIDDTEMLKILADWKAARKKRSTAWVPRSMKYNSVDAPSPAELQLVELQARAGLDIANAIGIDPEELGISTTSRTYANVIDRRRDKINDVLSPYMLAITQRLSMGDVTRREHRVKFDLADYLKSNPTEQASVHKSYKDMGVLLPEEIRGDIGRPPLPPQAAPVPAPAPDVVAEAERIAREAASEPEPMPEDAMNNSRTALQFNTATATADPVGTAGVRRLELDGIAVDFRVEKESRTIWGMAIPYNQVVRKYGMKFRFLPGSIEYSTPVSRVKFLVDHMQAVGYSLGLTQTRGGLLGKYKLGRSKAADDALMDAEDGVYDGLSVSVEYDLDEDALYNERDGVWDIYRARLNETSLTAMPAFDDARITKVVATQQKGNAMEDCAVCGQRHAPGMACASRPQAETPTPATATAGLSLSPDQLTTLLSQPGAIQALVQAQQPTPAVPATPSGALTLSAEQVTALISSGGLGTLLGVPQLTPAPQPPKEEGPQVVDPTRRRIAVTAMTEPLPYRFDREGNLTKGVQYDFSTDLISGSRGDGEAMGRAQKFLEHMAPKFTGQRFDVDKADAAALNPNINRPDMYVDQKDFSYPIWDAISKGTVADATPFVLPKFNTATGLVAAHVEAVEPTPGTFTATAQTITPSAVSGRVEITREAWDQGGNPQLSGLIWRQMTKAWFEALEASAVVLLDGLAPTVITLTTGAADAVLVGEVTAALSTLQFVRGGLRMRDFFLQVDLYKKLVDAQDASGRKLLPRVGAVNADGQVSDFFADLDIGGLRGRPAWGLAASGSVAANSYLFDRNDVSGWATAPQRLEFQYRVAFVDVAIWGYKALANTDLTGVRKFVYDPVI